MTHHYQTLRRIQQCRQDALRHIAARQQPGGGFASSSGEQVTFYASLIACALEHAEDPLAATIRDQAGHFLAGEMNEDWSFNYWQKGASEKAAIPYPNDLDDTFAALRALSLCMPHLLTPQAWNAVVSLLISAESAAGGPYQTWLVPDHASEWHDIDIVVNSNIASFLEQHGIRLTLLTGYLEKCIAERACSSRYYHDAVTVLYFVAKGYRGSRSEDIRRMILERQQENGCWASPLATALAITTLLSLGEPIETLSAAIRHLTETGPSGTWPDEPLFVASRNGSTVQYSSCSAHVSACCVEALCACERAMAAQGDTKCPAESRRAVRVAARCRAAFSRARSMLKGQLDHALVMLAAQDPLSEVSLLAYRLCQACPPVAKNGAMAEQLAAATVLGWIGYTVMDKALDGESILSQLPFATKCIRESAALFQSLSSDTDIVGSILTGIENAVLWEHAHCRVELRGTIRMLPGTMPQYGRHGCLAEKSLGIALPAIIICQNCGNAEQARIIEQFFRHYLIARQLNDDAHDWLQDLEHGFLNSVSAEMLQGKASVDLSADAALLQQHFWNEQIDKTSGAILKHCHQARNALSHVTVFSDLTFLEHMLLPLEQAALQAVSERDRVRAFLAAL